MDKAEVKSFGLPDEVREFPHGRLELLDVGGAIVGRAVTERAGGGLRQFNLSLERRVAKPLIFSTTFPVCCG